MFLSTLFVALLGAASASAHATFQELWVNGVDKVGTCVRTPASNSPVTSVTTPDLACNVGGTTPAATTYVFIVRSNTSITNISSQLFRPW
ncbi:hypothetical protein QCA50_009794 [Cerrena zonata]|uniref:Uncharacterized protein n=1 Tax=Cerrena zonata TaxID=2478898 RepID=A0AAW0G7C2_9APHY